MADFTVTVSLNLPETCREQAKKFIDWQGKMVKIIVVIDNDN